MFLLEEEDPHPANTTVTREPSVQPFAYKVFPTPKSLRLNKLRVISILSLDGHNRHEQTPGMSAKSLVGKTIMH